MKCGKFLIFLKNATNKSLVLLDEVGRGTSTYDGLSIAWSVIEYITGNENLKCKTLFATHYHELTKLEGIIDGVKNYSVAVKKMKDSVIFLRKIIEGGADESYGIEVAKLAGLPQDVIDRAKEILLSLEGENNFDIHKVTNTNNKEIACDNIEHEAVKVVKNEIVCEDKTEFISQDRHSEIDNPNVSHSISHISSSDLLEENNSLNKTISNDQNHKKSNNKKEKSSMDNMQLDFAFMEKESLIKELSNVDILSLNPMEAMNTLYKLVAEAKKL
ncbi:DNA mismatch repair ATPase MutS [Clostridium saccharobutylicum]|nr:DNA mismatch repair ATPase MutS [Clostridium saccharobutylicum]